MIPQIWLVVLFLGASLCMKRSHEPTDKDPEPKRQEVISHVELVDDLFAWLPSDVIEAHIGLQMTPSSLLVMSMTSKAHQVLFRGLFDTLTKYNQCLLTEDLIAEGNGGQRTTAYYMIKKLSAKCWTSSKDCLIRFRLRHLCHSIVAKANNNSRNSTYPIFYPDEDQIPYIQVPMVYLGYSAIKHLAYGQYAFNSDLVLNNTIEALEMLKEGDDDIIQMVPGECEKLIQMFPILLKELDRVGLLKHLYHEEVQPMLKRLLEDGLDAITIDELDDGANMDLKTATLVLMLHQVNETNLDKVLDVFQKIDHDNIQDYAHFLCSSRLETFTILELLYRDPSLDCLLIYALLIANRGERDETWFSEFYEVESIKRILDSYSAALDEFEVVYDANEPDIEYSLFISVCRQDPETVIRALMRRTLFRNPVGAFFFLLLSDMSEELIRYFLTVQFQGWSIQYPNNIPYLVTIPNTLLADILPHLDSVFLLSELIPDPYKYVDALQYIDEHELWTERVTFLSVVQNAVKYQRPVVLQAVLDLATKKDFCKFALQPIFSNTETGVTMAMHRLPVMEYLHGIPHAKLLEVIEKSGPQTPDILNPASEAPVNSSMLPLIFRIALTNPRSFFELMRMNYKPIFTAMMHEAWNKIFDNPPSIPPLPHCFFMLIRELVNENEKAGSILFPVAMGSILGVFGPEVDFNFPADFTCRHKKQARNILGMACTAIPGSKLLKFLAAHKEKTSSPFLEAAFRELMRRPKALTHILDEKILKADELIHLLCTFLPMKYMTDDLLNAIRNGNVSEANCPWLYTGIPFNTF